MVGTTANTSDTFQLPSRSSNQYQVHLCEVGWVPFDLPLLCNYLLGTNTKMGSRVLARPLIFWATGVESSKGFFAHATLEHVKIVTEWDLSEEDLERYRRRWRKASFDRDVVKGKVKSEEAVLVSEVLFRSYLELADHAGTEILLVDDPEEWKHLEDLGKLHRKDAFYLFMRPAETFLPRDLGHAADVLEHTAEGKAYAALWTAGYFDNPDWWKNVSFDPRDSGWRLLDETTKQERILSKRLQKSSYWAGQI